MSGRATHFALSIFAMALVSTHDTALADTFIISNGEKLEGKIVQAKSNVVAILRADGELKLTYISEIRQVQIPTDTNIQIEGKLLHWSDGVTVVSTGDEILRVRDGTILATMGTDYMPAEPGKSLSLPDGDEPPAQSPTTMGSANLPIDGQAPETQHSSQHMAENPASSQESQAASNGSKESFLNFLREQAGTERAE